MTATHGFGTLPEVSPNFPAVTDAPLTPLEAARELAPLIRASADETDAKRELPKPVFHALADAGLYLMSVPRAVGGPEIDFPTYVQAIEEIGKADASTAWTISQGANWATYSARMAREAAREIWIDTPRSVVSNTPGPTAQAVVVPGGYRVTGRNQPFSTGCKHASWVAAHATVIENGAVRQKDGKPEARYCLIPVAQVEILDTWHTRGMRGTGTHAFVVNDVFVPAEKTVLTYGAPLVSPGPRYKIPLTLGFAAGDGMVALGLARSCMNAFYELAGSKTPRNVTGLLRDQPISQFAVGQAEAAVRSGRAFLMEAVCDIWDEATSNDAPTLSLERRAVLRLASTHAIRLAAQIVESIYTLCGATAVFDGNLIQRHFQDMHVITQHAQGRPLNYELVGKHWLGLPIEDARM